MIRCAQQNSIGANRSLMGYGGPQVIQLGGGNSTVAFVHSSNNVSTTTSVPNTLWANGHGDCILKHQSKSCCHDQNVLIGHHNSAQLGTIGNVVIGTCNPAPSHNYCILIGCNLYPTTQDYEINIGNKIILTSNGILLQANSNVFLNITNNGSFFQGPVINNGSNNSGNDGNDGSGCCVMCDDSFGGDVALLDTSGVSATHEFFDDMIVHDNLYVSGKMSMPRVELNDSMIIYNRVSCHSWKMFVTDEDDLAFRSKQGTLVTLCEEFTTGLLNFTGSHLLHVDGSCRDTLRPGHILVSMGVYKDVVHGRMGSMCMDDALPMVTLSRTKGDKKAFGVFSRWERNRCFRLGNMRFPLPRSGNDVDEALAQVNSAGEGCILVNGECGDFENGDLIMCSSSPGVGCKQYDDVVRSCTVAKITCDCSFDASMETKLVGCIYKF